MPFALIKRGKKRGMYRSPSGRTFTRKQVRRYYARGGTFDIKPPTFDARSRESDPTRTGGLRDMFMNDMTRRTNELKSLIRDALIKHDMFGFSKASPANVQWATTADKVQAFGEWLHATMNLTILRDNGGGWVGMYVGGGYKKGLDHARLMTEQAIDVDPTRGDVHSVKAMNELRGIAAATEQHVNRSLSASVISGLKPADIAAQLLDRIDDIAIRRTEILCDMSVVNAHAEASLDAFEALGIERVGIMAEMCPVIGDESPSKEEELEQVNREHRKVRRIPTKKPSNWRQYLRFRTADDDDVCPTCEALEGNVYLIKEARGLIPVHPHCRCAFVPHFDRRFAQDRFRCQEVSRAVQ